MVERLVLLGGGHANIHVMDKLGRKRFEGFEIVMISQDSRQYYSGMVAGFLEGIYDKDECSFDLAELCQKNGVLFVKDEVISIDKKERKVQTISGKIFHYDLLSVNTGSGVRGLEIPGSKEFSFPIKPFGNLQALKNQLLLKAKRKSQVVIVGGGAAGVEIACAVSAIMGKCGIAPEITILDAGSEIMKTYPKKARFACVQALDQAKVNRILGSQVVSVQDSRILLESGIQVHFDILVWATGPSSQNMYSNAGLEVDARGFLLVDTFLRSVSDPRIWGAGDCVSVEGEKPVPKNGVYAIREARILTKNLLGLMENTKMVKFLPKSKFLSIVPLGKGQAIASYAGMYFQGKLAGKLKNLIDCAYMRRYRHGNNRIQ